MRLIVILSALSILSVTAQTLPPPANPPSVAAPATAGVDLPALEAIRAANLELINKQQAVLQRLDELQKEADQIRILAKRS